MDIEVEILTLISGRIPPIMSIVEPEMAIIFWAHSPISSKHISTLYLLLDPYLNPYHSNRVVLLEKKLIEANLLERWNYYIGAYLS